MSENTETKYVDPMDEWNEGMEMLLGKEKWESLNYWQKMCEVAALRECIRGNPHGSSGLIGFDLY